MKRHVLSVLVSNHSGVLSRVAGLFSRRGYNIDSLSVGETENPDISRMTIVAQGDDLIIEQIMKQLDKLHDVYYIKQLPQPEAVCKEMALIKVSANNTNRVEIIGIIDIFEASIVDAATEALTIEVTGDKNDIDTFITMIEPYGIKEMTRTGIIALQKGNRDIKEDLPEEE
ncbi:acetolactate synthase small subunit [Anaerotalea alkaliphila]|uniref:Acetolactate synthase small subunit n=1 Tax=Anaerotalea alkaliphila TaxID=2662126 RepID=A0A7X5HW92_9FIRM|nr:acetolactate synthase small subunit [Anaerotalea alkaliphila]NDL67616.1 acetolactate synthase small subunit [Anaerotalea alkaliphila]